MDYLDALEREMERTVLEVPPGEIETIFVGGGTPTVLTPEQMASFLSRVQTYFGNWAPNIEFTMEANPGTTDLEKLQAMKEGGVNRISFGVQSFDNALLERIGRIHNTDDVYRSLENARKAGFANMSIDLMFGLPTQTIAIMEATLAEALKLDLPHYSIYSLKVEENTLFHALYERGNLPLPEEEEEVGMFLHIMKRLREAGYGQYEISNFAKPGFESRHNAMYWRNQPYYGLGAGAHGYVHGKRHVNIKGVQPYIEGTRAGRPLLDSHEVDLTEAMEDFMMVGLRLLRGVRRADFTEQFNRPLEAVFGTAIRGLLEKGLLEETAEGYRLSEQGILLGNDVFGQFLEAAESV